MSRRILGAIAAAIAAALALTACGPAPVTSRTFEEARHYAAYSEEAFIDSLSEDEAFQLASGETGTVNRRLILPDGQERNVAFAVNTPVSHGLMPVPLVPANAEDAKRLAEAGWKPDAALQRRWEANARVVPALEQAYGISLSAEQQGALLIPLKEPSAFTRYGSTLATFPYDGGYFDGEVTLIWDGEFKLITDTGTGRAEELARPVA